MRTEAVGGPMGRVAKKGRKRPGLARRMARRTVRLGMLATAVFVGRKSAGGAKASDGQGPPAGRSEAPQGLGGAAGGGPGAGHETDPGAVADDQRGRRAEAPQQIPPKGWKD